MSLYADNVKIREAIYSAISTERKRQEDKFPGRTVAHPDHLTDPERLFVLVEEVGEVARAIRNKLYPRREPQNLREELVQVAAVAVAWLEADVTRYGL